MQLIGLGFEAGGLTENNGRAEYSAPGKWFCEEWALKISQMLQKNCEPASISKAPFCVHQVR